MRSALAYVRSQERVDPAYRYRPDHLYDFTARMLFKRSLHKESSYRVLFSRRGQSNRTRTLAESLERSRDRYCAQIGIHAASIVSVGQRSPQRARGVTAG